MRFEKVSLETFIKDCEKCGIDRITAETGYEKIELPVRSTIKSAGYDFVSPFDSLVLRGKTVKFPTGIKAEMSKGWVLFIIIRSSLGLKYGLTIPNSTGVIDADYYNNPDNEGDMFVAFRNDGEDDYVIKAGDKVAQGIFLQYGVTENDKATGKRQGGIGSTGA